VGPEVQDASLEVDLGCEAGGLTGFRAPGILRFAVSGSSSVVEHRLAKARVASSNLVSRSNRPPAPAGLATAIWSA
jgi:hypothetical protein